MASNKRGAAAQMTKDEDFDRIEGPVDVPQKATAAQMAGRKIRSFKPRGARPQAVSVPMPSENPFAAPQQPQAQSAASQSASPFGFGGPTAFGGSQAASRQSSPFNFGGSTSAPSSFNSAEQSQPATAAATSAFSFGQSQPVPQSSSSSFTFGQQTLASSQLSSSFSFGQQATSAPPVSNMFNLGQQPPSSQPESSLFNFGQQASVPPPTTSSEQQRAAPPQTSSGFSFGQQTSAPPTTSSGFSFGQQTTAPSAVSSGFNFGQQATAPPTTSSGFSFGQTQQTSSPPKFAGFASQPSSNVFNFAQAEQNEPAKTTSQQTPGLFSSQQSQPDLPQISNPFNFGKTQQQQEQTAPPQSSSLFSFSPQKGSIDSDAQQGQPADKSNLFNFSVSTPKQQEQAVDSPAPQKSLFNFQPKTQEPAQSSPPSNPFGFGATTSQPSSGIFSPQKREQAAPSQDQSTPRPSSPFTFGAAAAQQEPSTEKPKGSFSFGSSAPPQMVVEEPKATEAENTESPKGNGVLREQQPTPPMPNLTSGTAPPTKLTSPLKSTASFEPASSKPELPKIPKAHVPKTWIAPPINDIEASVEDLSIQLATLNERYFKKLAILPTMADWSALSVWHQKESSVIVNGITALKKLRAAAKGVTGQESTLSVKRKANDESSRQEDGIASAKKPRALEEPASPSPAPKDSTTFSTSTAPRPESTQTSSLFGKIVSTVEDSASESDASTDSKYTLSESSKATGKTPSKSGFSLAGSSDKTTSQSGFTFGGSKEQSTPKSGFTFGGSSGQTAPKSGFSFTGTGGSGGSGGFLSEFSKKAKTFEELAAERKKKAMEEDYDSDDETKEEWSVRYDKEEAERRAQEEQKVQASKGFSFSTATGKSSETLAVKPGAAPTAKPVEGSTTTKSFPDFKKSSNGASTPGLFSPRVGSPAPSTAGGTSVFDSPGPSKTTSPNIFGHLSSNQSSASQDEDSDEEDVEQQEGLLDAEGQSESERPTSSGSSRRKFLEQSESEDEPPQKKDKSARPSLLSRMSKAGDVETKEQGEDEDELPASNGIETPKRPFAPFDFAAAAAKSAPPKSDTFGGDQTFKHNSPIKFGGVPATEKKPSASIFGAASTTPSKPSPAPMFGQSGGVSSFKFGTATPTTEKKDGSSFQFGSTPTSEKKDGPTFQFQPATPSPADFSATPSKPFAFLAQASGTLGTPSWLTPNVGQSGPGSIASSVFSSRAATPLSEAETSGRDSAAETEDEDAPKAPQLDLSGLSEEEQAENDILFHTEQAIAKKLVDGAWENFARGGLWILKNKETDKAFVRMRLASGSTPLNYALLPKLQTKVAGASKKMVSATRPGDGGKLTSVYFAFKSTEIADEFSTVYNANIP